MNIFVYSSIQPLCIEHLLHTLTLLDTRDMSKVLFFVFCEFFFNLKDAQFSLKDIHSNHRLSTYCIERRACIISFNPHNHLVGELLLFCQLNK